MPYVSLYRKYRPRNFAEVVGQRHVTQTLANAVKAGRIAHAYLLCGPRGTGKTSTAKALAMALNCEEGPTPEPCGECDVCRAIIAGSALDVMEIDAASNRGIDEIRALRDRVGLSPVDARTKVYIIDEVHMLTGEAFNAFLKTLEEPPAHVVFVLATTEPHRVLPTILSRCQRFDFHRIGLREIEGTVRRVAEAEAIDIEEKAVAMIAHAADGSARDALTLLDQSVAYAEGAITPEVVTEILGGINFDLVAELTDVFIRREVAAALAVIDRVVSEGKDLRQLLGSLIEHHRNLLLLRLDRRAMESLALPEEAARRSQEQAEGYSTEEIVRALDLLAETDRELRFSSQPRLLVELCAVRACRPPGVPKEAPEREEAAAPRARGKPARRAESAAETVAEAPAEAQGSEEGADLAEVRNRWDELLTHLRKSRKTSVAAFLREAVPVALEEKTLTLAFNHQFHYDQLRKDEKRRQIVAQAVADVFGREVTVACKMAAGEENTEPTEPKEPPKKIQDLLSMFPGSELDE
jgi:DNA polymerase-3 subunit gamma/tau